ncbi:hypothetical protein DH2020_039968 [Rehmannia glutinosa]|uniref:AB hydrolase-1 domain-containing protein n=1 Tax=Rehmannia glutinosa TaxID=99300 RepID=A0ABR0UUE5_REHGL
MAAGQTRKISAASARAHTRKPKSMSPSKFSESVVIVVVVVCVWIIWDDVNLWKLVEMVHFEFLISRQHNLLNRRRVAPQTALQLQHQEYNLRGRYLAYQEYGVPKDKAKHKIVFIHGFDCCRHDVSAITAYLSPDIVESQGVYIVSFDRPGYGESDPHPTQTVKSLAFDIEELADQLGLGKFYVVGFSIGGQIVWRCLKLAGAALIAPVVNYWWPGIPSNMSEEAYKQHLVQDQWAIRVAHYLPWLNYWWNTQKLFPGLSLIALIPKFFLTRHGTYPEDFSIREAIVSSSSNFILCRLGESSSALMAQVRQQGEFESLHVGDSAISLGATPDLPKNLGLGK